MTTREIDNAAWPDARPRLSVLIPFHRNDPSDLIRRLDSEAAALAGAIELVLLDDGGGDAALTTRVAQRLARLALPARLVVLSQNVGRARGRNRLAAAARGRTFLFLDSDMRPDAPDFLQVWADLEAVQTPAVAIGGFSLLQAPDAPEFAVHRALAAASECIPAAVRARTPEKYVYTSNLMVRRDVFSAEAFDTGFSGWGWEDVEWGLRVARRHKVLHPDNPATHMGLDTVATLAAKYASSGANFARVAERHPEVRNWPGYRAARLLQRLPWPPAVTARLALKAAEEPRLPVRARAFALRLYRAAVYAGALP
ncbi:MAG: glycosyltransferase family 2 protein [Brevundimonas sp.]|jgi:glycosyltransferase involved in cell wall biosynthesis|uniref:glycosyltransferase family 2 protein n=2 Tax=Brevundimonas sp. TaxID=1871086 RepID=UPI0022BACF33|nr:glycosyltransferase family A protein [Brevundimonas sp.]